MALILKVVNTARELVNVPAYGMTTIFGGLNAELLTAVRMLDGALKQLAPAPTWRAGTWAEVTEGDRVRLGGQEAVVASAVVQDWHMRSGGDKWWEDRPEEHRVVFVKLVDRGAYSFPPSGQVEILDVAWPKEDLASWVACAAAVLEHQAMESLKRDLGAKELDQ